MPPIASTDFSASAARPPALAYGRRLFRELRASWRAHRLGYLASLTLLGAATLTSLVIGQEFGVYLFFSTSLAAVVIALLGAVCLLKLMRMIIFERPDRPIKAFAEWLRRDVLAPERLVAGLHAMLIVNFMGMGYGLLKSAIPLILPFSWDMNLAELDKALHFGLHPWQILQPLLGTPLVTFAFNVIYNAWFFILAGFFVWIGFMRGNPAFRMQYLLASILCWGIGGNALAILLSSAGPCYFEPLGLQPNPYAPLMDYLHEVNQSYSIWALATQDMLWKGYLGENMGVNMISAMPSMHIATSTLFALVAYRASQRLGLVMSLYALLIFLGSVHLGWHFAIDGYFGALIGWASWHVAGRMIAWDRARIDNDGAKKRAIKTA